MQILLLLQHWLYSFVKSAPRSIVATAHSTPEAEYVSRLTACDHQLFCAKVRHRRLWICLTAALSGGLIFGWAALSSNVSWLWLTPLLAIVACCFQALGRNARLYSRLDAKANFYEGGVARLNNRWQGQGRSGDEYASADHIYAADLDIFGSGSLFELLCTARTGIGRKTLAKWLLDSARPEEIASRQAAVAELRDKLDLMEGWACAGSTFTEKVESCAIEGWAKAPLQHLPRYWQALAIAVPFLLAILIILFHFGSIIGYWPFVFIVAAEALIAALLRKRTRDTAEAVELPAFELGILAPLLVRFQREPFQCPLLKSLQSASSSTIGEPSVALAKLRVLAWLLQLRSSEYFALALAPMLWGTNLALAVESWRTRNSEALCEWLRAIGHFEALLCLARYAYEHPDYAFPRIVESGTPFLTADGVGHPLLSSTTCVRCDLTLRARERQLIIVSGSNMSGKSTLLRALGMNVVLAMAGAPVCATQLTLSPLRVGCSIAVRDSLLEGRSRFKAEVERLKRVIDMARKDGALVLLDEVLNGTNSEDRLFGARTVLGELLRCGALVLVTTHDLALTKLADVLDPPPVDVHFEENYENGEMTFDYKLRPGALIHTNGSHVIAALGLGPDTACPVPSVRHPATSL